MFCKTCFIIFLNCILQIHLVSSPTQIFKNYWKIYGKDYLNGKTTKPIVRKNSWMRIANHQINKSKHDLDTKNLCPGDIIFIDRSAKYFFDHQLPRISVPIIIIFWSGDHSSTANAWEIKALRNKNIILYLCINCLNPKIDKVIPIPIGCSLYHREGSKKPTIQDYIATMKEFNPKEIFCLSCFRPETSSSRKELHRICKKKYFINNFDNLAPFEYSKLLSNSYFCISPFGSGLDCYRTWEALIRESIPVVNKSPLNVLYHNLPVLIVENLEKIKKKQLDDYLKFARKNWKGFHFEKLFFDYWEKFLYEVRSLIIENKNPSSLIQEFKKITYDIDNFVEISDKTQKFNRNKYLSDSQSIFLHNL